MRRALSFFFFSAQGVDAPKGKTGLLDFLFPSSASSFREVSGS